MKFKRLYLILFGVVATIILAGIGFWFYLVSLVNTPVVPENLSSYDFTVESGETIGTVITKLKSQGFVNQDWPLRIYLKLHPGSVPEVQAGSYKIIPNLSMIELLQGFKNGQFPIQLVFIEGWRREQYVEYLAQQVGDVFAQKFDQLSEGQEGYLFPDTYFMDTRSEPDDLLATMKENFSQKLELISPQAGFEQNHLSEAQAIVLASILEREVNNAVDRTIVAGILLKRLANSWPLETDATVQYAVASQRAIERAISAVATDETFEWWPKTLTEEDLRIDSPFNTRRNPGIPPAPICNPGLDAIEAVAKPIESPYWFYLTDQEGVTRYAETLAEHNQNIQEFGLSE